MFKFNVKDNFGSKGGRRIILSHFQYVNGIFDPFPFLE